jgi:hypothetical protein
MAKGFQSRVHRRAPHATARCQSVRSRPTRRARRCAPVSSMYWASSKTRWGGKIVRTISIVRARFKCGMRNLGYNIRRLVQLERMAAVTSTHLNIGLLGPTTLKFVVRNKIWFSDHLTESPWFGRRRRIGSPRDGGEASTPQRSALESQIPYQILCHSCLTDSRVSFYRR